MHTLSILLDGIPRTAAVQEIHAGGAHEIVLAEFVLVKDAEVEVGRHLVVYDRPVNGELFVPHWMQVLGHRAGRYARSVGEIGRASCRERV